MKTKTKTVSRKRPAPEQAPVSAEEFKALQAKLAALMAKEQPPVEIDSTTEPTKDAPTGAVVKISDAQLDEAYALAGGMNKHTGIARDYAVYLSYKAGKDRAWILDKLEKAGFKSAASTASNALKAQPMRVEWTATDDGKPEATVVPVTTPDGKEVENFRELLVIEKAPKMPRKTTGGTSNERDPLTTEQKFAAYLKKLAKESGEDQADIVKAWVKAHAPTLILLPNQADPLLAAAQTRRLFEEEAQKKQDARAAAQAVTKSQEIANMTAADQKAAKIRAQEKADIEKALKRSAPHNDSTKAKAEATSPAKRARRARK